MKITRYTVPSCTVVVVQFNPHCLGWTLCNSTAISNCCLFGVLYASFPSQDLSSGLYVILTVEENYFVINMYSCKTGSSANLMKILFTNEIFVHEHK